MIGIVVAVDDSPGARAALAWEVGEATLRGTTLRVVHVHKAQEWTAPLYFPSQHAAPTVPVGTAGEPPPGTLQACCTRRRRCARRRTVAPRS